MNDSVYLISGGFFLVYVGTAGACGLWYSSFVRPLSGTPDAHTAMFCVSVYCILYQLCTQSLLIEVLYLGYLHDIICFP